MTPRKQWEEEDELRLWVGKSIRRRHLSLSLSPSEASADADA